MTRYAPVAASDVPENVQIYVPGNGTQRRATSGTKIAAIVASVFGVVCVTVMVNSGAQPWSPAPNTWLEEGADSCSKSITMPLNQCIDIFSAPLAVLNTITSAVSGGSSSSTSAVDGIAKPIMKALVKASPELKKFGSLNFCLGSFTGATIRTPPLVDAGLSLRDMDTDGCKFMPLNPTVKYTVMSFGVSQSILDSMGLCSAASAAPVAMCLAYGTCENGLPTFAIQISGAMVGCMGANPSIGASTAGIAEILGEAASLGIVSIGFGVSASGSFQMPNFGLWAGSGFSITTVTGSGNVYANLDLGVKGALPAAVAQYLTLKGVMTAMIQLGTGNMATEVKTLVHSANISSTLETLTSASMMGQMTTMVAINLETLTHGALPDMALGSFTIDGLLSTQSVGGLDAGFYVYAKASISVVAVMEKALSWAETCLADVIDTASGQTGILSTASTKLSSAFSSSTTLGQFGLYLNANDFGVLFEFPAGSLFPFNTPLGTMSINCQFHFQHGGLTCGVNYDKPAWVAAIVSEGKMVVSSIKTGFKDALTDLKSGIKEDWTVVVNGVKQAWSKVKTALTPDHGKKLAAGLADAKKAKLGGGRKIRGFFKGLFGGR